jgi:hypothetical protein
MEIKHKWQQKFVDEQEKKPATEWLGELLDLVAFSGNSTREVWMEEWYEMKIRERLEASDIEPAILDIRRKDDYANHTQWKSGDTRIIHFEEDGEVRITGPGRGELKESVVVEIQFLLDVLDEIECGL